MWLTSGGCDDDHNDYVSSHDDGVHVHCVRIHEDDYVQAVALS